MRVERSSDRPDLAVDERPRPMADHVSAHYWKEAAQGRLVIQRCPACQHRQLYPRAACVRCGAEPDWMEATGRGVVHTFTVVHQNGTTPFKAQLPYVIAMIELEEGPRIYSNVTDVDPDDVHIGMPVIAYAVLVDDDLALPLFRPASTAATQTPTGDR